MKIPCFVFFAKVCAAYLLDHITELKNDHFWSNQTFKSWCISLRSECL